MSNIACGLHAFDGSDGSEGTLSLALAELLNTFLALSINSWRDRTGPSFAKAALSFACLSSLVNIVGGSMSE